MIEKLKSYYAQYPLNTIVIAGLLFRLLAVIFAKGFAMHDDHFLIVEISQSWVDGFDSGGWLPKKGRTDIVPSGHSLFYTGLHYCFFYALKAIGIIDPQLKMYLVRFLHALWSLLIIILSFKITKRLSNKTNAAIVGWILALLWCIPFLSVRNLVEVVCIPPLLYSTWLYVKKPNRTLLSFIGIGFIMAISFSVRFQTILFAGGFGLTLLFKKQLKESIAFGLGYVLCVTLIQGGIDYFVWGKPFVEFMEYVNYNIANEETYVTMPWYQYFIVLGGILVPPISLFLLFGYFKEFKRLLIIFLPSFLFFAFHSYFANKQERFIFPVVPFVIIGGVIGWQAFIQQSSFWQKRTSLLRGCYMFAIIINLLVLPIITTAYSKRNRVESMYYLSQKKDLKRVIIEDSNNDYFAQPPQFYLQNWVPAYPIDGAHPARTIRNEIQKTDTAIWPNYIVFVNAENIVQRIDTVRKYFPKITYETKIDPSFIDKVVHWLNPINDNQTSFIYKIEY